MRLLDIDKPLPTTDEEAIEYSPDDPSAHGMYRCLRELNHSIVDAMVKVFNAVLGLSDAEKDGQAEEATDGSIA